jgi:hypothetical protein
MVARLKTQSTERECQLYIWQGMNKKNIQGDQKAKLPKNQWPNEEMGKWTEQSFFKGKSKWLKTHEELLNMPGP